MAILREAGEKDIPALIELLNRSSDESIKLRFFGPMHRDERTAGFLIRTQLDDVDSGRFKGLCLILLTGSGEHEKITAVASCIPLDRQEAEIAFLVEDASQGKGIGTLMIERLAFAAEIGGMLRLVATTSIENEIMLKVFHDCGYNTVNRLKTGEIDGIATVSSLGEIEEPLDLVVICIAADRVLDLAQECADIGARSLLVLSDGFADRDETVSATRPTYRAMICFSSGKMTPTQS